MFLLDIMIIIIASILVLWARVEGRKEKNRIIVGDFKAEDFEIIEG